MVYDMSSEGKIDENHSVVPKSPYAATKLAGEELALSYFHGYGLPVVILRPFNTYGPCQRSDSEGGVVNIFIKRFLENELLEVYGDGTQTRDLLYVEDCADFIVKSGFYEKAVGEIINGGLGKDISIKELATMISKGGQVAHVAHHHPQAEITKLLCDNSKAKRILNWEPKTSLSDGLEKTIAWIKSNG
jgi:nucleoside-diphosphate-sugar epimerase